MAADATMLEHQHPFHCPTRRQSENTAQRRGARDEPFQAWGPCDSYLPSGQPRLGLKIPKVTQESQGIRLTFDFKSNLEC